jgi:hypothetical protein
MNSDNAALVKGSRRASARAINKQIRRIWQLAARRKITIAEALRFDAALTVMRDG